MGPIGAQLVVISAVHAHDVEAGGEDPGAATGQHCCLGAVGNYFID